MPRVVLVTGASSGIGNAVAAVLSTRGYRVFGTSRSAVNGDEMDGFTLVRMDVTNETSVNAALDYIRSVAGRLDAVINNAGVGFIGPIENTSDQEARDVFDTNLFGVLNVCRQSIPLMRDSGGGYIINITSIAGQMGLPFRGIYSASKFAVEGFTESLSQEVGQFGIRVCLIEPGDFNTSINSARKSSAWVHPAYGDQSARTNRQVCDEVSRARTPESVGYLVDGILSDPAPALRYRAANIMQRFSITLMRILPDRMFERIIRRYYRIP
jgi:NAD(P)-dependent dehydrogenase (short-subunit alcohol dehydrogenase family)